MNLYDTLKTALEKETDYNFYFLNAQIRTKHSKEKSIQMVKDYLLVDQKYTAIKFINNTIVKFGAKIFIWAFYQIKKLFCFLL